MELTAKHYLFSLSANGVGGEGRGEVALNFPHQSTIH